MCPSAKARSRIRTRAALARCGVAVHRLRPLSHPSNSPHQSKFENQKSTTPQLTPLGLAPRTLRLRGGCSAIELRSLHLARTDSNRRPLPYQGSALPPELQASIHIKQTVASPPAATHPLARADSNRHPLPYKGSALPIELRAFPHAISGASSVHPPCTSGSWIRTNETQLMKLRTLTTRPSRNETTPLAEEGLAPSTFGV